MLIDVIVSTAEAAQYRMQNYSTIVVIDVLRATSVIVTALSHGAKGVYPVVEVDAARELAAVWQHPAVLLGGERNAIPLPGFDLGNSPLEYTPEKVQGHDIIMTTTNGTKAMQAASAAKRVLVGALLNAKAIACALQHDEQVALLCAGTYQRLDIPDLLAAGAIIAALGELGMNPQLNDLGRVSAEYFAEDSFMQRALHSYHGNMLTGLGRQEDLDYCLQLDTLAIVPRMEQDGNLLRISCLEVQA